MKWKPLTHRVKDKKEVQFAIDLLEKDVLPYKLVKEKRGLAIFIPKKEMKRI